MKYRSRTEIIAMMLQAASQGATKTRIMYRAYLSYAQLKEYLKLLEDGGLVNYEAGTMLYKLTEKGLTFLHTYDKMTELVPMPSVKHMRNFDTPML